MKLHPVRPKGTEKNFLENGGVGHILGTVNKFVMLENQWSRKEEETEKSRTEICE